MLFVPCVLGLKNQIFISLLDALLLHMPNWLDILVMDKNEITMYIMTSYVLGNVTL